MSTAVEPITTMNAELIDCLTAVADAAWDAKDWIPAKRAYSLVIQQDEKNTKALNRLGRIALMSGEISDAIEHFDSAYLADADDDPIRKVNLAIAYSRLREFDAALFLCQQALDITVKCKPAFVQMAAIHDERGDYGIAESVILKALELFPGDDDLLFALGTHQLRRGDFDNGWRNYEHRAARREIAAKLDEYPEWTGQALEGKTLLVVREQGIGDQIMWARYLAFMLERGSHVILFTDPDLARLIEQSFPDIEIITSDQEAAKCEPDYWVAMGSLPLRNPGAFSLADYLIADPPDTSRFAALIPATGNLRVGLCWKGNPKHQWDRYRSLSWEQMKPLLDVPGVDFYSLQSGDTESGLLNLIEYVHDFADTAAAIANLDLVITVDTSVAHLAGAMGKPVWMLIGEPSDWRWGGRIGNAEYTDWYPSMELFRQRDQSNWAEVIEAVAFNLRPCAADGYHSAIAVANDPIVRVRNERKQRPTFPIDRGPNSVGAQLDRWACATCGGEGTVDAEYTEGPYTVPCPDCSRGISSAASGPCRYGRMTWLRNDHYIGRSLALYGEYSESEAELYRKVLKRGDVVVDAGANIGSEAVAMAEIVGTNGVVYAFEPQPAYFSCLKQNAANCAPNTILPLRMALGAEESEIMMRSVEERKAHAPGWPSTGPEFPVYQETIDSLKLSRCALIKVDVDGPEHDILRGAERTIDRLRPVIYVEHDKPESYPDMLPWLHAKGYRLYQHFAPLFNPENFAGNKVNVFGSIVSAMILCVPMERKDLHPTEWGLQRMTFE